jgi:hypothetical protein
MSVRIPNRVEIAPGASPADDPSTFAWVSAGKRRQTSDITITAGRDDEASSVEAGTMSATMDDRDGNLSPRNILGKWYGSLEKNTPVRVVMDRAADPFTRTVGAGSWGTSPDGFAWQVGNTTPHSVDGSRGVLTLPTNNSTVDVLVGAGALDAEIVWSLTLPVMPTGSNYVTAGVVRYEDDFNYVRAHIEIAPGGSVSVKIARRVNNVLSDVLGLTSTSVTYTAGTKLWGKTRADGGYILVKTWTGNLSDEPATWQGVGTEDTLEGAGVGLFNWRLNTNAGTYTSYIDDVAISAILWQGTVPEWPVRWPDKSGNDCITPISGSGVLRRLQQGSSALQSALRHHLAALPYTMAYYPAEDGTDARSAASGLSRGKSATAVGVSFAADDRVGGSAPLPTFDTAGKSYISALVSGSATADGWAAMGICALPTLPATDTAFMVIQGSGTAANTIISCGSGGMRLSVYDRDNNLLFTTNALYVINPAQPFAVQVEFNTSGGTTTGTLIWHQIGATTYYSINGSFSGTALAPTGFEAYAVVDGMTGGHFWLGDNDLPFVTNSFSLISSGYVGELAADRIARLCAENDVPVTILSGDTEPMGRQRVAKLVDLLRECEAADMGVLYERGTSLAYIPRERRYNTPVAMAIDWAAGDLGDGPEPQDDDQRFRNQWTVTRSEGSSATARDSASITAVGLYDDETEMNIQYDARLIDFAGWLLNRDTSDLLRWPRISINLLAHPELISSWLACRIGSRITVANTPQQIAGEVIDLIIEGYSETINNDRWDVELSCSPAALWEVAVYNDSTDRYDVLSRLSGSGTVAAATRVFAVLCDDRQGFWSSTSVPYDVVIAGQRSTVLGCSLPDTVANGEGTFELGVGGWKVSGGTSTLVATSTQVHTGTGAALATVAGSPTQLSVRNNVNAPTAAGQQLKVSAWVYRPVAGNVTPHLDWYDSGGTFLSRNGSPVAVAANTWTLISTTATAPASAARVEYGPSLEGSPANGTQLYVDDVDLVRLDAKNSRQIMVTTRGVDGFTKALPGNSPVRIANRGTRYAV